MILNQRLLFLKALIISIFFHFFLFALISIKNKTDKYTVLDLSSFGSINSFKEKTPEPKKVETEKKISNKIQPKKNFTKKVETKKKNSNRIQPKKVELKKINKQVFKIDKNLDKDNVFNKKVVKEKLEKDSLEKKKSISKVTKITEESKNYKQKVKQEASNLKILKDEALIKYLNMISNEVNRLANNFYPRQSILRREQGKILSRIIIDSSGLITKIEILTIKPERLSKATKKLLLRKKQFVRPPDVLFEKNKTLTVEIPINYILK